MRARKSVARARTRYNAVDILNKIFSSAPSFKQLLNHKTKINVAYSRVAYSITHNIQFNMMILVCVGLILSLL